MASSDGVLFTPFDEKEKKWWTSPVPPQSALPPSTSRTHNVGGYGPSMYPSVDVGAVSPCNRFGDLHPISTSEPSMPVEELLVDKPFSTGEAASATSVCNDQCNGPAYHSPASGKRVRNAPSTVLALDPLPGPYSFRVQIAGEKLHGSGWTYSPELKILYTEKGRPVDLDAFYSPSSEHLRIRVMAVYASDELSHKIVRRCFNHVRPSDPSNAEHHHPEHVVRVSTKQCASVVYHEDECTGRYSVLVPLVSSRDGKSRLTCRFMCQSTCVLSSEVENKRISQQLGILFTLEGLDGTVIGRDLIRVRCCSNPSRDKETDLKKLKGQQSRRKAARSDEKLQIGRLLPPHPVQSLTQQTTSFSTAPNVGAGISAAFLGSHPAAYVCRGNRAVARIFKFCTMHFDQAQFMNPL